MSVNKSELTRSISQRGHFSIIPNEIWTLELSMKAKIVFLYLLSQSDTWNPGLRGIAEGTSISVPTARLALKELEDANMITVSESIQGLRNVYCFTSMECWKFAGCAKTCTPTPPVTVQKLAHSPATDLHTTVQKLAHIQEEDKKNKTSLVSEEILNPREEEERLKRVQERKVIFLKREQQRSRQDRTYIPREWKEIQF